MAHWHRFQVLTKRSKRLLNLSPDLQWAKNIWMGMSVESCDYYCRIDDLRKTPAAVKFLSIEPMLGPMHPTWPAEVRDQCLAAGVSFFFKQWGGANKKRAGRLLEDRTWDERPTGDKIGKKPFDGILTGLSQCGCLESISTQQAFNLSSAIFDRRETTESPMWTKMSFPSLCVLCDLRG